MKLAAIDAAVIAAYLGVIVYITARSRQFAARSLDNFFLGGRNMPGWMTGVSYAASMMSADSAVAYGGLAAISGLYVSWWYLSRFGIAFFFGALLFAVYWRRLNTFTTLEFYELRFEGMPGMLMRLWLAIRTSLIAMVAWTGISLLALAKISEAVLGWGKTQTLAVALPVAVAYVFISGYLGVVLSNLVQMAVMMAGAAVLAVKVLNAAGGPQQLGAKLAGLGPSVLNSFPPVHDALFPAIAAIAWLAGTSVGYGGDAAPMSGAVEGQRILSSRSPKEACKMYIVTEVTVFTLVWLVSVPCLAAAIFWPQLRSGQMDRELAYGLLMTHYLGPGLLGLVFAAMLGGIISVVGDNLNFGSQVLLNDIYRRHLVKDASELHYMFAGRLAIFVILGLALVVVYKVTFIFDVAIFMVGLSASEMSANWAQWWWWRFNGWARVAASFGGALAYISMRLLWPEVAWWNRMFGAMAISTVLWVITSLATPPERARLLSTFYRRARPPGSWARFRHQNEVTPLGTEMIAGWHAIATGIGLSIAGAAAVMAYIVGISNLYVGRYARGGWMLAIMLALGTLFWFCFDSYIRRLLLPQEWSESQAEQTQADQAVRDFGLSGIGAAMAFAVTAVFTFQWLAVEGGRSISTVAGGSVAGLSGLWLWRKYKASR